MKRRKALTSTQRSTKRRARLALRARATAVAPLTADPVRQFLLLVIETPQSDAASIRLNLAATELLARITDRPAKDDGRVRLSRALGVPLLGETGDQPANVERQYEALRLVTARMLDGTASSADILAGIKVAGRLSTNLASRVDHKALNIAYVNAVSGAGAGREGVPEYLRIAEPDPDVYTAGDDAGYPDEDERITNDD